MLRLKNLANKYQKRTCRPVYANTQATPYAASLDSSFRTSTGALQLPKVGAGTAYGNPTGVTRATKDAYTLSATGSLCPGLVVTKVSNSEGISIANGQGASAERPFGLLANFVGGDLDEGFSGDSLQNEVGVWRGPDSVFEILAPAYDALNMPTTQSGVAGTKLYAQLDGRLGLADPSSSGVVVGYLVKAETNRILVDLAV